MLSVDDYEAQSGLIDLIRGLLRIDPRDRYDFHLFYKLYVV